MSLKSCISKAGPLLSQENREQLHELADRYQGAGLSQAKAEKLAVRALRELLQARMEEIQQARTEDVGTDAETDIRLTKPRTAGQKIAASIGRRLGLSAQETASTSLEMQTGLPKSKAFSTPVVGGIPQVIKFLEERRLATGLPELDLTNEDDRETLSRLMSAEALAAINGAGSALEWYDATINTTLERMALKFPELRTDQRARTAFVLIMAVTSQGLNVENNLGATIGLYEEYRRDGRFSERGEGESAAVMAGNFKLLNLLQGDMGPDLMARFLKTEFTVGELKQAGFKVGGELIDEKVLGSSVLGPKIGFGFFSNLTGNFDPVTMDMWFMRTIGRLTGKLRSFDSRKFAKQTSRFLEALMETGTDGIYAADMDLDMVIAATAQIEDENGALMANEDAIVALAREIDRRHQREFISRRADFDSGVRQKTDLVFAAGNIVKSMDKPKDSPASGGERRLLRDVVRRTVEKVSKAHHRKVPAASLQALIWYPEQELYKALGVKLQVTSQDYAGAALKILKEGGIDEQQLLAAGKPGSGPARQNDVGNDGSAAPRDGAQAGRPDALKGEERDQFLAGRIERELLRKERENPSKSRVIFEVAPDPSDTRLVSAWRALDSAARLRVSKAVAADIVSRVVDAYGVKAISVDQVGSYLDDTNPSFALILDRSGSTLDIAHELGYVLAQDAMMAISPRMFAGAEQTGAVFVEVGDKSSREIEALYRQLRSIMHDGKPAIGGQTTINGQMTILNYSGMETEAMGRAVSNVLGPQYTVTHGDVFAAFPEKADYDF